MLTVLILLGLGSMLVLYVLGAGVAETRRALGGQRVFYACDSAIRLASKVAESVVLANPRASAVDVTHIAMDAICDAARGCVGTRGGPEAPYAAEYSAAAPGDTVGPAALMPPHTIMERFYLRVQPLQSVNTIQSGAFRDFFAVQSRVKIRVQGMHTGTGTVASARDTFSLATISPFNLMAFANVPVNWSALRPRNPYVPPGMPLSRVGPSIYVDGATTLGSGGATLNLTRAISTGALAGAGSAYLWNGDLVTPLYNLLAGPDGVWAAQIRTPLTLPSQPGRKQNQPAAERARSARWLLDPPMFVAGGDNAAAREAKLAMQADIRIIDGVWFIKPPSGSSEPEWPGIPIWSDHLGVEVVPARPEAVTLMKSPTGGAPQRMGQEDLRALHAWPRTPIRYSFYEQDDALAPPRITRDLANTGIVSYGQLKLRAGRIEPGAYEARGASGPPCGTNNDATEGEWFMWSECPNKVNGLLDATRYGFIDGNARTAGMNTQRVLPMNFDIARFLAALADGTPGELGSYFCGARFDQNDPLDVPTTCRPFNGIIWMSATWPGSLDGLTDSNPAVAPPRQGRRVPSWDAAIRATMDPVLPPNGFPNADSNRSYVIEQLCTGRATNGMLMGDAGGRAGPNIKEFSAVECGGPAWTVIHKDGYGSDPAQLPTVTAVRIIGARDLSVLIDHQVPQRYGNVQGLTVATNLPLYVHGDWNIQTGATFASGIACPAPGVTPVPPDCLLPKTILAGDRITLLSNAGAGTSSLDPGYNDFIASWHAPAGTIYAKPTTYVSAFMTTVNPSPAPAENIEKTLRVMQRWDLMGGLPSLRVVGAVHVTGRSVYRADPQAQTGSIPQPQLDWLYNPSLATLIQPPGTPRFLIGVTNRWRDLRDIPEGASSP